MVLIYGPGGRFFDAKKMKSIQKLRKHLPASAPAKPLQSETESTRLDLLNYVEVLLSIKKRIDQDNLLKN